MKRIFQNPFGAMLCKEVPLSLEDVFISYLGERGEKSFFLDQTPEKPEALEVVGVVEGEKLP